MGYSIGLIPVSSIKFEHPNSKGTPSQQIDIALNSAYAVPISDDDPYFTKDAGQVNAEAIGGYAAGTANLKLGNKIVITYESTKNAQNPTFFVLAEVRAEAISGESSALVGYTFVGTWPPANKTEFYYKFKYDKDYGQVPDRVDPNDVAPYACFLQGTAITTMQGRTKVENLKAGDQILTAEGKVVSIAWIGRKTILPAVLREEDAPVRIAAGALGKGLPDADLCVSADHAVLVDGLLVNAGVLINGSTITRLAPRSFTAPIVYYHIETQEHVVLLANGAPAESFVDYVGRSAFDNYDEYLAVFGTDRIIPELPYTRVSAVRHVPQDLRERLNLVQSQLEDTHNVALALIA